GSGLGGRPEQKKIPEKPGKIMRRQAVSSVLCSLASYYERGLHETLQVGSDRKTRYISPPPCGTLPKHESSLALTEKNPKDIAVSFYYFHHSASFLEDPGTFEEFLDKFLEGKLAFGKWTDHIKSWKNAKLRDRIIYITYEEMKEDLPAVVRSLSSFLGKNLSDEVIHKIAHHCSFDVMKNNPMSNFSLVPKIYIDHEKSPFLRKGVTGDWKNHFTSEQLRRFCSTIKKEMEGESFTLPWSLD
uniref:Sulfotransferase n=1 Tax=Periophthalmus magnuspinnatus TaxID=409849 RepID=A0A3B4AVU3_9GOBI